MAHENSERGEEPRLYQIRWILVVSFVLCALFAYLEPRLLALAAAGFVAIVLVGLLAPREALTVAASGDMAARRAVWPGTSTKSMAEALGYPAYILDADANLRYANASAEAAFGFARPGDPLSYKFRRPEIARLIDEAIQSGKRKAMEYEERVPRERWYAVTVAPIPASGQGARPVFYLVSFIDLTETRRAEQMRSDFIANASHELRTPLASLRGFIETIQGPASDDPVAMRKFLGLMLEQAERMSRLIDDLLSLSRIEMKAHVRPGEAVDLAGILRHVANALEPLAGNLGVTISLALPEEKLPVRGDRDELIQVVENLVENACKYGQSGGKVELSARIAPGSQEEAQQFAEVSVRDHGPGIPAEHLPRLTERFYRVDVASSREKQGTGLGLAIVKHILNRHGTRLRITSKVGQGADFAFRLPIERDEEALDK